MKTLEQPISPPLNPIEVFGLPVSTYAENFYDLGEQYLWFPKSSDLCTVQNTYNQKIAKILAEKKKENFSSWRFMNFATTPEPLKPLKNSLDVWAEDFSTILVLGTGGSSLGAKALYETLHYDSAAKREIVFLDNVDPKPFELLKKRKNFKNLGILLISKSGSTPETMAQTLFTIELLSNKIGKTSLKNHILCITEPKDSPLTRLAKENNLHCLDHDKLLGGRFSVLSKVGLSPYILGGGDASLFQCGVEKTLNHIMKSDNPPFASFLTMHTALAKFHNIKSVVTMIYGDAWRYVPDWFTQLWAESLGKNGLGTMPIGSLGTQDQHSLLQMFLDGPQDKLFTILISKSYGKSTPLSTQDPDLQYLNQHTLGQLIETEAWATVRTLIEKGYPVRVIHTDNFSVEPLGAVMLNWMIETALQAELWGLNAFDQPAVEYGKKLTKTFLN